MKFLFLALILLGCGRDHSAKSNEGFDFTAISAKRDTYLELIKTQQDSEGFLHSDKCDSTLFTGLSGAGGMTVDLTKARASDGQWYRRPLSLPECLKSGGSASTISRDMLLGVVIWGNMTGRLDVLQDLIEYGVDHTWIMGESDGTPDGISRIVVTPPLIATLADCVYKMSDGADNHSVMRTINPQAWVDGLDDYQLHLQMLHMVLRGRCTGSLEAGAINKLKNSYAQFPSNPLVQYVYARFVSQDFTQIGQTLMDERLWPSDRLPTSAERCDPWLQERDPPYDACPEEGKTHTGGDFLFVSKLVTLPMGLR